MTLGRYGGSGVPAPWGFGGWVGGWVGVERQELACNRKREAFSAVWPVPMTFSTCAYRHLSQPHRPPHACANPTAHPLRTVIQAWAVRRLADGAVTEGVAGAAHLSFQRKLALLHIPCRQQVHRLLKLLGVQPQARLALLAAPAVARVETLHEQVVHRGVCCD